MEEVRLRLSRKGYAETEIEGTVGWLLERQWLSDRRVAEEAVRFYREVMPRGSFWIKRKLLQRGVSADLAEEVTSEYSSEAEEQLVEEEALRQLERLRDLPIKVQERRLIGRLLRRGFPLTLVQAVCKKLLAARGPERF